MDDLSKRKGKTVKVSLREVRKKSFIGRDKHPEVPWSDIIGMRHVLVHEYFGIDLDIVWQVVKADLPALKHKITAIVDELGGKA